MKRRRFFETSLGAGFAGAAYALSPSRFKHEPGGGPDADRSSREERFARRSQMGATETLARFISELRYEDLSPQAIEAAKIGLLDGVGVILAGSTYQPLSAVMANYVRQMGGAPRSSVAGWGFQTNPPFAAFANGVFGHALDYEIQACAAPTHGTSACLPSALALGEETRASGRDIILAYVLGIEVQWRLRAAAAATGGQVQGFHPPGVVGPMGGAAASASVLGLDVEQTRMALGYAASRAGGVTANTGTFTKSTHPGDAARMGVEAALLAQTGYTSNPNILEARSGYVFTLMSDDIDWDLVTGGLGTDFIPRLVDPGFNIKRYPAQIFMQTSIESVLNLRETHGLRAEEVQHLTMETERAAPGRPTPPSGLDGKFSIRYCASAALLDGRVDIESFKDERRFAPDMEAMLPKVSLSSTPRNDMGARATALLNDGRTVSEELIYYRGSCGNPMTREERLDKFRYCVSQRALSDQDSEELIGLLENLEAVDDISTVMDLIGTRAPANL